MVARDERHDVRFGIGLPVVGARRGLQSQQNRASGGVGYAEYLHVIGIGQQLLQQHDVPKRVARQSSMADVMEIAKVIWAMEPENRA